MNRSNYIIGLTGGIATGKSSVASILKSKGYMVIDYDEISRNIMGRDGELIEDIKREFGDEYILNGAVNRAKLGALVFSDEEKRNLLNSLTHDKIIGVSLQMMSEAKERIIFLEIPLLFEVRQKLEDSGILFDEIWMVTLSAEVQVERLMKRDGIDREYAIQKIASQMPISEKESMSDIVIVNDDDLDRLEEKVVFQIENLLERINA